MGTPLARHFSMAVAMMTGDPGEPSPNSPRPAKQSTTRIGRFRVLTLGM